MIKISILKLIVAKALPFFNNKLSSNYFTIISAIVFSYSGMFSLHFLYIQFQCIGSGIGIYSGLFHITHQLIKVFKMIQIKINLFNIKFILNLFKLFTNKIKSFSYSLYYKLVPQKIKIRLKQQIILFFKSRSLYHGINYTNKYFLLILFILIF
jgi:hypothetical protein